MTYRERREARAERLRGWAEKRQTAATASLAAEPAYRNDWAFITQPGPIPERARMNARDASRFASLDKAASMESRASGIEAQLDKSIYSDDPDAIERLEERIADLETERDRIKAYNVSCRKGMPDESLLNDAERKSLESIRRYCSYQLGKNNAAPSYWLTNLGGNISRQKQRLEALKHPAPTWFHASRRDPETCYKCDQPKDEHTPHAQVPSILMCPKEA